MIKLSLCVPIYGVEKEIPRFLDSLEKNLCEGVEVILVDDGAKDNSGKIADAFAKKYSDAVRVIHKPNGGLSSARNKGLEMARGEYVIFPDPDDYLADDYVSTILDAIEKYDAPDMILFDYYTGKKQTKMKRKTVSAFCEGVVRKENFIREFVKDKDIRSYVWNKAIKRSFYKGKVFDTRIKVAEDFAVLTDMVPEMDTIVYVPVPLYYYMIRESSLSQKSDLSDLLKLYELVEGRYQKYSALYEGLSRYKLINCAFNILRRMYLAGNEVDATPYEQIIKDNIGRILREKEFTFNDKKRSMLVCLGLARRWYK